MVYVVGAWVVPAQDLLHVDNWRKGYGSHESCESLVLGIWRVEEEAGIVNLGPCLCLTT